MFSDARIYPLPSTLVVSQVLHQLPKMDIQIFENFALPPVMDVQIFTIFELPPPESLADLSSAKRAADEGPKDEPPPKRYKLTDDEINEGVTRLVRHYGLNEYQKRRLKFVANRTNFVPTVDEVEWVVEEAKLRDGNIDLDFFMFPYMEFYPWYFRSKDEDFRLYIGAFIYYDGMTWPVWMRFAQTASGPKTSLYLDGPGEDVEGEAGTLNLQDYRRQFITWWEPFDHLFQLARMTPENRDDASKHQLATDLQDDYFRATVKVLARFPGLILERDPDDETKRRQVYSNFSTSPFLHAEAFSPVNPLAKLFEMLCAKKTPSVREAESKEKAQLCESETTDHDEDDENDGSEDGAGNEA